MWKDVIQISWLTHISIPGCTCINLETWFALFGLMASIWACGNCLQFTPPSIDGDDYHNARCSAPLFRQTFLCSLSSFAAWARRGRGNIALLNSWPCRRRRQYLHFSLRHHYFWQLGLNVAMKPALTDKNLPLADELHFLSSEWAAECAHRPRRRITSWALF